MIKINYKKAVVLILALPFVLSISCRKNDADKITTTYFKGTIIGHENCTKDITGYLIEIETPSNIGNDIYYDGEKKNVVKSFNIELQEGSIVEGFFQYPDKTIERNCVSQFEHFAVPEIIIDTIY